MAELLILKGANVNAVSTGKSWTGRKWTPLNYAIRRSQKGIAGLLILKGANVNAVDKKGGTPSHWANHVGHEEVVELLIKHGGHK